MREGEKGPTFVGRAVIYNEWSGLLYGCFVERIAPGAFDASLRSADLVATINHDLDRVLGRQSADTLRVVAGEEGIDVEVDGGAYSYARDLAVAISRGDLRGMSFIFDVVEDKWDKVEGRPARTVLKADIYEVSFVTFPAYTATTAGVRSALALAGEERAIAAAKAVMGRPRLRRAQLRLAGID